MSYATMNQIVISGQSISCLFLSFDEYIPPHPVIQNILMMPAIPLIQFHHPPFSHTPSFEYYHPFTASAPLIADSKSEPTAIRMLMATITNGKHLNQSFAPMLVWYLRSMKPIQPATAA